MKPPPTEWGRNRNIPMMYFARNPGRGRKLAKFGNLYQICTRIGGSTTSRGWAAYSLRIWRAMPLWVIGIAPFSGEIDLRYSLRRFARPKKRIVHANKR